MLFVNFWVCIGVIGMWLWILGLTPAWAPQPASPMPLATKIVVYVLVVLSTILAARMLVWVAMSLAGRVEVTVGKNHLIIRSGIGPIGRTRYVDLFKPEQVQLEERIKDGIESVVGVEVRRGESRTKIISSVPEERLRWLVAVLRDLSSRDPDGAEHPGTSSGIR